MYCPNCHSKNTSQANFCPNCGAPLKGNAGNRLKRSGRWLLFLLLFLGGGVSLSLVWPELFRFQPGPPPGKPPMTTPAPPPAPPTQPAVRFSPGELEIFNPWGGKLGSVPGVLLEERLIALPVRSCVGGASFVLKANLQERQIQKGFWRQSNPLVVWQLQEPLQAHPDTVLKVGAWAREEPVTWFPVGNNAAARNVRIASVQNQGDFLTCLPAESLPEDGVFVQNGRLVGWTFKGDAGNCYLWQETTSERLESAAILPVDFYKATFAGGREELLAKALHLPPETSPAARLHGLLTAMQAAPRLSPAETPPDLQPAAIRLVMSKLVAATTADGQYRDLAAIFSNPQLSPLLDLRTLPATIYAAVDRYGYESTMQLLEALSANRPPDASFLEGIEALRLQIYREWLGKFIADNDPRGGRRLFAEAKGGYPQNPEIHLLGVELALLEGAWQEAEHLLNAMRYPAELQARAGELAARISQLKGQEGKITIRFPPGHKVIPVTALLNDTVKHSFYIDTGATMVTIPLATAEELGIEITPETPQRLVSTAGGVQTAYEVTINSITLGGWVVRDTRAFIIDIPDNPRTGLLGLNFLRNFRMDLDSEKGILVLEPL